MKFGQLIESNNRYIFLQKSCRKWGRKTSSSPFLFFLKKLYMINGDYVKWSGAQFQYILMILNLAYNKSKLYKTLDYWSWDMLNFSFLEKGLGIVSPPHFVYIFQQKCFSWYVLVTDQISLYDCLYFLRYWAICALHLFVNQAVAP